MTGPYVSKLKQQPTLVHNVCHQAQHAAQRPLDDAEANALAQIVLQSHRDGNLTTYAVNGTALAAASFLTYRAWRPFFQNRTGSSSSSSFLFSLRTPASIPRTVLRFGIWGYVGAVASLPLSGLYSAWRLRASIEGDSRLRDWNRDAERRLGGRCDAVSAISDDGWRVDGMDVEV